MDGHSGGSGAGCGAGLPGFHKKDIVENYLHNQVCGEHRTMTLAEAQYEILNDWVAVWKKMEANLSHHKGHR